MDESAREDLQSWQRGSDVRARTKNRRWQLALSGGGYQVSKGGAAAREPAGARAKWQERGAEKHSVPLALWQPESLAVAFLQMVALGTVTVKTLQNAAL